jgi:hypothetical protein
MPKSHIFTWPSLLMRTLDGFTSMGWNTPFSAQSAQCYLEAGPTGHCLLPQPLLPHLHKPTTGSLGTQGSDKENPDCERCHARPQSHSWGVSQDVSWSGSTAKGVTGFWRHHSGSQLCPPPILWTHNPLSPMQQVGSKVVKVGDR